MYRGVSAFSEGNKTKRTMKNGIKQRAEEQLLTTPREYRKVRRAGKTKEKETRLKAPKTPDMPMLMSMSESNAVQGNERPRVEPSRQAQLSPEDLTCAASALTRLLDAFPRKLFIVLIVARVGLARV